MFQPFLLTVLLLFLSLQCELEQKTNGKLPQVPWGYGTIGQVNAACRGPCSGEIVGFHGGITRFAQGNKIGIVHRAAWLFESFHKACANWERRQRSMQVLKSYVFCI